jgi:DNA primase
VTQKKYQRADTESVASRLLKDYELWKSGENEWRCVCPFHVGARNKSGFRIKRTGWWDCYVCGAGGSLTDLVMAMEKLTFQQAQDWLGNAPTRFLSLDDVELLQPYADRLKPQPKYEILKEATIALSKKNCPNYLIKRGFTEEILVRYNVGYDLQKSRIVIPTRDVYGKLVGITLRLDFDGDGPKYWHDCFDKSMHLYGFHLWARKNVKALYLVEGQLDAVRMGQIGLAACAILGSSMSKDQADLLDQYAICDKLVLMFDNDDAGKKAADSAIKRLVGSRFGRSLFLAKYPGKDPGDLKDSKKIELVPWWARLGEKA